MFGIQRCETCGGLLECAFSEREFTARCRCPTLKGVRARAVSVSATPRAPRMTEGEAVKAVPEARAHSFA